MSIALSEYTGASSTFSRSAALLISPMGKPERLVYELLDRFNYRKSGSGPVWHPKVFVSDVRYSSNVLDRDVLVFGDWVDKTNIWYQYLHHMRSTGDTIEVVNCNRDRTCWRYVSDSETSYFDFRTHIAHLNLTVWEGNLPNSVSAHDRDGIIQWLIHNTEPYEAFQEWRPSVNSNPHSFADSCYAGLTIETAEVAIPEWMREERRMVSDALRGMYHYLNDSDVFYAMLDAVENVPQATANSMLNVIEAAGACISIIRLVHSFDYRSLIKKSGRKKTSKKIVRRLEGWCSSSIKKNDTVKDIWLKYRYLYSTTKMDIGEYAATARRLIDCAKFDTIGISGSYVNPDGIRTNVTFDIPTDSIVPSSVKELLYAFGFNKPLTNAWDAVPFSFMVDWATGVGDFFSNWEGYNYAQLQLPATNMWCTRKKTVDQGECFSRFPLVHWPPFDWSGRLHKTQGKVWGMRIADALSIFTKGR